MKQENVLRFFKNIINTIITNIIFTLNSSNQKSLIALVAYTSGKKPF
jgi:hypothetical protein